jgi:hypothetical protein
MKEALSSFETSVLTRATQCNIPEGTIFHSHGRENLSSVSWAVTPYSLVDATSIFNVEVNQAGKRR